MLLISVRSTCQKLATTCETADTHEWKLIIRGGLIPEYNVIRNFFQSFESILILYVYFCCACRMTGQLKLSPRIVIGDCYRSFQNL